MNREPPPSPCARLSMPSIVETQTPSGSTSWTGADGHLGRPGARRSEHLALEGLSPVNENGSFEFDRVLKSGRVLRRSKNKHSFKASWKSSYMVLRPNLLSVYKDEEEARLQLSIAIPDISAVALVKASNSKRSRANVFGVFSPAKNYRFQASSREDAENWVSRIRSECTIPPNPDTIRPSSHIDTRIEEESAGETSDQDNNNNNMASSLPGAQHAVPINVPGARKLSHTRDYSGNEITSCSDLSDVPGQPASFQSASSFGKHCHHPGSSSRPEHGGRPSLRRDASQHSDLGSTHVNSERVIFQGYLQCLKNVRGVRQWKRLWVVLRCQNLYLYKNEQEYSATKIIPMEQVINAAEIDSVWRSRPFCFQVIAEDKTYRFSAPNEEAVDKWLGSLTSVLIKLHGQAPSNSVAVAPLGVE